MSADDLKLAVKLAIAPRGIFMNTPQDDEEMVRPMAIYNCMTTTRFRSNRMSYVWFHPTKKLWVYCTIHMSKAYFVFFFSSSWSREALTLTTLLYCFAGLDVVSDGASAATTASAAKQPRGRRERRCKNLPRRILYVIIVVDGTYTFAVPRSAAVLYVQWHEISFSGLQELRRQLCREALPTRCASFALTAVNSRTYFATSILLYRWLFFSCGLVFTF